jgi:hypothetical protein
MGQQQFGYSPSTFAPGRGATTAAAPEAVAGKCACSGSTCACARRRRVLAALALFLVIFILFGR